MGRFSGKSVLVLGASSPIGIGAATARLFAREGAKVVVSARNFEKLKGVAEEIGGTAIACDASDHDQVENLARKTVELHGGLDIAINTVAIGAYKPISEITPEDVMPTVNANFVGSLYFLKHMCNAVNPDGAVIMTSSSSVPNISTGLVVYASTKAAINHAIKVAALEYAEKRLRINAVQMSLVLTESSPADAFTPEVLERFAKKTPLGRIAKPEDCAEAYAFAATGFMSGHVIDISGGSILNRASLY